MVVNAVWPRFDGQLIKRKYDDNKEMELSYFQKELSYFQKEHSSKGTLIKKNTHIKKGTLIKRNSSKWKRTTTKKENPLAQQSSSLF